jgi:RNA polymerase I-specific transcription initiation factor RRN3
LFLLFDHINKRAKDDVGARELYRDVMPIFESSILVTHKSKFVQFCIFQLCGMEAKALKNDANDVSSATQQHAVLNRDFAAKLIDIIMDPYRATLTRQSGACYLASFISRASFICSDTVCEAVSALLRWAEAYISSLGEHSIRAADARDQGELHSLFYTVCQAAFYIMCFRGEDAIKFYRSVVEYHSSTTTEDRDEDAYMPEPELIDMGSKRWTMICGHELQPLRFCLESVRSEFLHVAHAFDLVEEHTLNHLVMEAKRLSTGQVGKKAASRISTAATLVTKRKTGGVGGLGRGSNPLNSFFPFDPFLLRRAHAFIEPFYNYWQGPIEEEDMVESDDEEEAADPANTGNISDDESDVEEEIAESLDSSLHQLSFTSTISDKVFLTPDNKKVAQRNAWTDAVKRPRSHSIENGSW